MESLFFNIQDNHYSVTKILNSDVGRIDRVDIQNGLLFFNLDLKGSWRLNIKDVDSFVMVAIVNSGELIVEDSGSKTILGGGVSATFYSSYCNFSVGVRGC